MTVGCDAWPSRKPFILSFHSVSSSYLPSFSSVLEAYSLITHKQPHQPVRSTPPSPKTQAPWPWRVTHPSAGVRRRRRSARPRSHPAPAVTLTVRCTGRVVRVNGASGRSAWNPDVQGIEDDVMSYMVIPLFWRSLASETSKAACQLGGKCWYLGEDASCGRFSHQTAKDLTTSTTLPENSAADQSEEGGDHEHFPSAVITAVLDMSTRR